MSFLMFHVLWVKPVNLIKNKHNLAKLDKELAKMSDRLLALPLWNPALAVMCRIVDAGCFQN